ncbi:MAG TPA: hypothetical protein QGE93_04240 [Acidobacteriota bacterium]|nr:hypothetical protein [Acidobacteriota bacterium]
MFKTYISGPTTIVLVLLLLTGTTLLAAPQATTQQELLQQLQRGIDELQQGNLEKGLEEIEKVIASEPRLAQAHYYAGMANAQAKQWQKAYDYFVAATQQMAGYGDAHMQACRVAYSLQNYEDAYMHAVWAAQAGIDMTGAIAGLEAVAAPPSDLRRRLEAPRVLIGPIDTEALFQQEASVFGGTQTEFGAAGADQTGSARADPFAGLVTPGSSGAGAGGETATGTFPMEIGAAGAGQLAQIQGEIHEVRRRFGEEFVRSEEFGVVSNLSLASHVLFIKVDDVGEGARLPLKGFVKLFDAKTQEEVYSRPLELTDIASVSNLRNEIARYLGYMEVWITEQKR